MAVRNFWIEGSIDGRNTVLAGGPQSKEGGLEVIIKQREDGGITAPIEVICRAAAEGNLTTTVYHNGKAVCKHETKR